MQGKIRTFIAIELESHVHKVITSYTARLQARFPSGFRWVKPELMHLTIKFLGDVDFRQVDQISQRMDRVCFSTSSFPLQINGTGAFPSWRNPRTVWIGLQKSQPLLDFHNRIDSELAEMGIPIENRHFSAHLTLCRVSDYVEPVQVHQLENLLRSTPLAEDLSWFVNEVTLFKSILKPGGPVYSVLTRHALESSEKV